MQRGCSQCGECLDVCPVYRRFRREEYSPKAKRLLIEPLDKDFAGSQADAEFAWEQVRELARLCAGCGRCQKVCARKLSTVDLLAEARAAHPHWMQQFWDVWITRMGPAWLSLGYIAATVPDWCAPEALKPLLATAKGLVDKADAVLWATVSKDPAVNVDLTRPVAIFSGCTARNVRGKWTEKAGALLRAWGYTLLDAPGFGCCGGTMHHAGRLDTQKHMEEHNIAVWRALGRPRVAVFCASCHHSLADYGKKALQGAEAEAWTQGLAPFSTLLAGAVPAPQAEKPAEYGYHQPCHWDVDKDMSWLKTLFTGQIQGLEPCCGMGGILQMSDAALSRKMADACLGGFPLGVKHILTGCSG
ncbi:MAG: (Fe-S)-binding protein, partial [Deltaproteobacteria bacterium]|nr:(Fe-S)-binding protein [Deltaproteobacteria bacterium]